MKTVERFVLISFWRLLRYKPFWGAGWCFWCYLEWSSGNNAGFKMCYIGEREEKWQKQLQFKTLLLPVKCFAQDPGVPCVPWCTVVADCCLWEADTGQIWFGSWARANVHHSAASIQLQKGRTFLHSCYSHSFRLGLNLCMHAQGCAMERTVEKWLHKTLSFPTLQKMLEYQPFCCCTREPDVEYENQW